MFKKCLSVSQEKKWLCEKKKESMEHEIHENTCRTKHECLISAKGVKGCQRCQRCHRSWGLGPLDEVSHLQEASGGQNLPWSQLAMRPQQINGC